MQVTEHDRDMLPRHIAIVMDGNGRWAEKHDKLRIQGHEAGVEMLRELGIYCSDIGIEYFTVYAFSTENWKRSLDEVNGIFSFISVYVQNEIEGLHSKNIKVNVIGDYQVLPKDAVDSLEHSINKTKNNTGMVFNFALNYGSRQEILAATKRIAMSAATGDLNEEEIEKLTVEDFSKFLYTASMPDPDLVIRTSGEYRLSNYLLWQSAYSEFYFTDTLWPDFTSSELDKAIGEYCRRDRRFGGRNK